MDEHSLLGCGIDHSVFVSKCGRAFVWGASYNNELGMTVLRDEVQSTPYLFPLRTDEYQFSASAVSCGDKHTAMIISDKTLPELKLIQSPEINITELFSYIIRKLRHESKGPENLRKLFDDQGDRINHSSLVKFFDMYLPPDSRTRSIEIKSEGKVENKTVSELLTKLLLEKDQSNSILFKEFRDQLYGTRVDNGIVITWGSSENNRLGRDCGRDTESDDIRLKIVRFDEQVEITKVSCGGMHTLAISKDCKLYAWGSNCYGQLGIRSTEDQPYPVQVPIKAEFVQEAAGGGSHSLALDNNGCVYAWGHGEGGRLGLGPSNLELAPVMIPNMKDVEKIAAGHSHNGLIKKGDVYTWGTGTFGRLGHGSLNDVDRPRFVEAFRGKYIVKLVLSVYHSAALDMNGEIWTWGNSKHGRLGFSLSRGDNQLVPVKVGTGTLISTVKIVDIALGRAHGVAVSKQGQLFAWGNGMNGQLGFVTNAAHESLPKEVRIHDNYEFGEKKKVKILPDVSGSVVDVVCSDYNTYFLTDAGQLLGCGSNLCGQLAARTEEDPYADVKFLRPNEVLLGSQFSGQATDCLILMDQLKHEKVTSIAAYGLFALIRTHSRKVYAWGDNAQEQLGFGSGDHDDERSKKRKKKAVLFEDTPREVENFNRKNIAGVSAGAEHSAFLAEDGGLYMCGSTESGRLGLGQAVISADAVSQGFPRQIPGLPSIRRVSCGYDHTAAIDYIGKLYVWGNGWLGKLGLNNEENVYVPTEVDPKNFKPALFDKVKQVACAERHTLVLTMAGQVYAAGLGKFAGLDLLGTQAVKVFHRLSKLSMPIKSIATNKDHSLAITNKGELYGWGNTSMGKLLRHEYPRHSGDPEAALPFQLQLSESVAKVACGANHSAAIAEKGTVLVWGCPDTGRLGLGDRKNMDGQKTLEAFSEGLAETLIHHEDQPMDKKRPEAMYHEVVRIKQWLDAQKTEEQNMDKMPSLDQGQMLLQSRIKNESAENHEDVLLADDLKLRHMFEDLLVQYDDVRKIERSRMEYQCKMECMITSKMHQQNQSKPKFKLTIPTLICKNIQLYENLIAYLQAHPCYIARIIESSDSIEVKKLAETIISIYGDLRSDPAKLRRLMMLYKIIFQQTHTNAYVNTNVKFAELDLATSLYFSFIKSEKNNIKFFTALSAEIMKIIYKSLNGIYMKKSKNKMEKIIHYEMSIDYITLENKGENITLALKDELNFRRKLFLSTMSKIKDKIFKVLSQQPETRKRFKDSLKLSREIKFMYKEIPKIFEKSRQELTPKKFINMCNSKIVNLFFSFIIKILREPLRISTFAPEEFSESFNKNKSRITLEEFIEKYLDSSNLVANELERVSNREGFSFDFESKQERLNANDEYLESLSLELTKERELNLTDLSITDLLQQSLEPKDPTHTMTLSNLINLHILLIENLELLKDKFPNRDDPVVLILETVGDIRQSITSLSKSDTKRYKLNLTIPARWLLRERGLQSCAYCKTPLTYTLLRDKQGAPHDQPLIIPDKWLCWNCGNSHKGWSMKCGECNATRRHFPKEYVFSCFVRFYTSPKLDAFATLLKELPPIPQNANIYDFLLTYLKKHENIKADKGIRQRIEAFMRMILNKRNTNLTEAEVATKKIESLKEQLNHEINIRGFHREFLNNMIAMINDISNQIKIVTLHFEQDNRKVLGQALDRMLEIGDDMEKEEKKKKRNKKAQGRITLSYLINENILKKVDLPKPIHSNTVFYFTEIEGSNFEVNVVLADQAHKSLCIPVKIEVKLMGFIISADVIQSVRHTMNLRTFISFCNGRVTFYNDGLVRLIGDLLKTK